MFQVLAPLSPVWETQMEFLALGFVALVWLRPEITLLSVSPSKHPTEQQYKSYDRGKTGEDWLAG